MLYLTGEYSHQMDTKNRIRIPNKLKGDEKSLYFAKGPNHRIFVFYESEFHEFVRKIAENTKLSDAVQSKAKDIILKSAFFVDGDAQGRMILPTKLKEYANIDRDVVICGAGDHINVWAKETYDKFYADEDSEFDNLFTGLNI